jgi:NADPH:quinone reductase-like Zn-dependent oxidoreductase/ketosteroid isomerase-like protein
MAAERERASRPEDLARLFVERANAGDAEGLAALYEPGAVLAYPPGHVTVGRGAIRAVYQRFLTMAPHVEPEEPLLTLQAGDLALTSTRPQDDAVARAQVARRQPDGTWLRVLDRPEFRDEHQRAPVMHPSTMHAVRAHGSDPAGLTYETLDCPTPGPGEVLVTVHATAVTAGELTWPETWPVIPGHDVSGVVSELGEGVVDIDVGDEVYGLIGFDRPGAAAEYVVVPATDLAAKPTSADHVAAATLPLGGLTAWQALIDHGHLEAGQQVLVHGGAGGVGTYAVQLAVLHGATVTATASADDVDFVTGLGARSVIDYTTRFEEQVADIDIVVDTVGGDTLARSRRVLRPGGILIGVAAEPPVHVAASHGVRGVYFVVKPSRDQLVELARLVDLGTLDLTVGQVFPLADTAAAIITQRDTHVRGKVAIQVRN